MKKFNQSILLIIFVMLSNLNVMAQPAAPEGKKWVAVPALTDEFKGKKLDLKKWAANPEAHPNFSWIGRAPTLFQDKNITVKDGNMRILVRKLPADTVIKKYGKDFTFQYGGAIIRAFKPTTVGGYYECRMKMNKTEIGGGFWLMGKEICNKKHEIDVTESVGHLSDLSEPWAKNWTQIMHSNAIHRETKCNPAVQIQNQMLPPTKNSARYYTYGFWWKSPKELLFYLDGKYVYTIVPPVDFDQDMFIHYSNESYDWNPIPKDGGQVAKLSQEDRTTYVDYIRTFKLVDKKN